MTRRRRAALCALAMFGSAPFVPIAPAHAAGNANLEPVSKPVKGKELPELATARSITWETDRGYVSRVYPRPVNVKVAGKWKRIDNKLYRAGDGSLVNGVGTFDLRLPALADGAVKLSHEGNELSLALRGKSVAATVDGSTASYAGVAEGVTAKLTADNEAVKEDLVLASALATSTFVYDLDLSAGLKPVVREDGGIDVVGDRDIVFSAPAPVAADKDGDVAPKSATSTKLEREGDGWKLTVALDEDWLKASGRAFPVVLDPSFALNGASRDCFLDQQDAAVSFCSSGELWAGRQNAGHNHVALTQFDLGTTVPKGAWIQRASLVLWPLYQTNPGAAKTLAAREVTSDWDNNATWNKKNATTSWATAGGELGSSDLATASLPASNSFSAWTVSDLVQDWVAGRKHNRGIAITDNGSTVDNTQVYASSNWSNSSKWPSLEIEYQHRVGALSSYTIDRQQLNDRASVGVNVAGGNLLLESSDLAVAGTGLSLGIKRYYNSFEPWDGQLGATGFRINYGEDIKLMDCDQQGTGDKCLIGPSGFRARFKKNGSSWTTPPGVGDVTLTKQTSGALKFELRDNKSGNVYEFFNNGFSFNNSLRDKNGNSNRIEIENLGTLGNISKITDTHGRQYPVTLNSAGYVTKIATPTGGIEWQYGYNASNFLTSVTDPDGKTTTYDYNPTTNRLEKITDPRGNETLIAFDSQGRVSSVTRKVDGTPANDVTTTYAYSAPPGGWCAAAVPGSSTDKAIGLTTVTDPRGFTTKYCWDGDGRVLRARDHLDRDTSTNYTPSGNVASTSQFAAAGGSTSSPYSTTAYAYANGGQNSDDKLNSITEPSQEKTTFSYNSGGSAVYNTQVKEIKDQQGNLSKYSYDSDANLTKIESQRGSGPVSLQADLVWDTANKSRLKTSTDKELHTTTYNYDPVKKDLIEVVPHNAAVIGKTELQTDGLSRVTQMKDGRLNQWVQFSYDKVGRQLSSPDSDSQYTTVTYDGNGNVLTRTAPGQSSSYTYDKLNRKTSETLHGTTTTYTYDKAGNLTSLTDASGTTSYEYDSINRVKKIISPPATGSTPEPAIYDYSDPTSPTDTGAATLTLPNTGSGSGSIKRSTDTSGKLKQVIVKDPAGTQTLKQTFTYSGDNDDNAGTPNGEQSLLTSTALQIGGTGATTIGRAYEYTSAGQVAKVIASSGGSTTETTTYAYDGAGNRTSRVKTPNPGSPTTTTYAYNEVNQLCWQINSASSVKCKGTSPGGVDTGSTTPAPYGAPPAGATTYAYDKAGNQTNGGFTGSWDAKGRIDGYNGIYSKILSPTNNEIVGLGAGNTFTNTILGVQRIEMGYNLTKLVRDPDGAAVSQIRDGVKQWFVTDQIGSTIALVDNTGAVKRTYQYDLDGNANTAIHGGGTIPETWIKFAGGHDIGGGLYHYGARFYQPSSARWTQMDPLLQPNDLGQANRYVYVAGDSINFTDPAGTKKRKIKFGVNEALGTASIGTAAVGIGCASASLVTGGAAAIGCSIIAGNVSAITGLAGTVNSIFGD